MSHIIRTIRSHFCFSTSTFYFKFKTLLKVIESYKPLTHKQLLIAHSWNIVNDRDVMTMKAIENVLLSIKPRGLL